MPARTSARDDIRFEVLTGEAALAGVRAEWDALWERTGGPFHARHDTCALASSHAVAGVGRQPWVVLGRRAGELVLAWPFTLLRRAGVSALRPLGPGMADYTPLLVDPRLPTPPLARAFDLVQRSSGADLAYLTYVSCGSALHALAASYPRARVVERCEVAYALLGQHRGGFDAYARACGSFGSKRKPGQLRRRLERLGAVTVRVTSGPEQPARARSIVDFVLRHKRNWAEGRVAPGLWLRAPGFAGYLTALLHRHAAYAVELLLDGRPVAASLVGLGHGSVTGLISAFDPTFAAQSPGLVMVEECVRYACERGLDFDFGAGNEPYKRYWSAGNARPSESFAVPLTLRGALALSLRAGAARLRSWSHERRAAQPTKSPGSGPEPTSVSPNVSTSP